MIEGSPQEQETLPRPSMNAEATKAFLTQRGVEPYSVTLGDHDQNMPIVWVVPTIMRTTFFKMFPEDGKPSIVLLKGIMEIKDDGEGAEGKKYALVTNGEAEFIYYALSPDGELKEVHKGGKSHPQYMVVGSALYDASGLF